MDRDGWGLTGAEVQRWSLDTGHWNPRHTPISDPRYRRRQTQHQPEQRVDSRYSPRRTWSRSRTYYRPSISLHSTARLDFSARNRSRRKDRYPSTRTRPVSGSCWPPLLTTLDWHQQQQSEKTTLTRPCYTLPPDSICLERASALVRANVHQPSCLARPPLRPPTLLHNRFPSAISKGPTGLGRAPTETIQKKMEGSLRVGKSSSGGRGRGQDGRSRLARLPCRPTLLDCRHTGSTRTR